jgi:hypothetical protein
MTIYSGSRYEYSTIDFYSVAPEEAADPVVFYSFSELGSVQYWEHAYIDGERLDQIAFKYYKKASLWWLIPEYNPEIIDFMNIKTGTILRIPNV